MQKTILNIKKHGSWLSAVFVTLVIAVLFYHVNVLTPLYSDDYCYSLSFATLEHIESVSQIPASQIVHYQTVNGRLPVHTLAQLFLLAGDECFNYFNTVGFLVFLYLIYFHSFGTYKKFSAGRLALIAMLLYLCAPGFGQSYQWITGAANYLYGMLIILLAMVPYRRQDETGCKAGNWLVEVLYGLGALLLGVLAGWTNENTAIAMIAMMMAYLVVFRCKGIRLRLWHGTELLGALIGFVCMLSSPASSARLTADGEAGGLVLWIRRAMDLTFSMFTYMDLLVMLFALLLGLVLYQNRQMLTAPLGVKKLSPLVLSTAVTLVYFLGLMAAVYSLVATGGVAPRTWSGAVVLGIIMVGNLSTMVNWENVGLKFIRIPVFLVVLAIFASTYGQTHYYVEDTYLQYQAREKIIEAAVANGERSVALPAIASEREQYTSFKRIGDIMPNSDFWRNEAIALYYGFDEVYLME